MAGRVVGHAVLPAAPYDAAPGASEGADRAGVVVPAVAGGGVRSCAQGRWWRVVSASVQTARAALVARPPEQAALRLPDTIATAAWPASAASVSRWVTRAASRSRRAAPRRRSRCWASNSEQEDRAVGMLAHGGGDLALQLLDLPLIRLDRRDQAQHQPPASGQLELPDPGRGSAAELCEQLRGLLAAGVTLRTRNPCRRASPRPRASAGLE